jgi:hypothetical protein
MAQKTSTVVVPTVLRDSFDAAGLSLNDVPIDGRIELLLDMDLERWWIRVELYPRLGRYRVGFRSGDIAREVKVIPFIGDMQPLREEKE